MALEIAICMGVTAFTGCGGPPTGAVTGAQTEQQSQTERESSEKNGSSKSGKDAGNTKENMDTQKAALGIDRLVFTYVVLLPNVPSIIEKSQETFVKSFEDMGISVEYAEINSGANQAQTLVSGDVQILYVAGAASVILSAANGADIKMFSIYSRSLKAFCMYSTDSSLTISESLEGKTVAGPADTNLHELLVAYLTGDGIIIEDVNYVNMGTPGAKAGLDGDSMDVALIAGATAYQARQQGYHMVAGGEGLVGVIIAVVVKQDFYDVSQDVTECFMKTQEETPGFIQDNQEETLKIVAQGLDLEGETVKEVYGYYDLSMETSDEDRDGFQKTADFMLESDMTKEALDVNTLFFQ